MPGMVGYVDPFAAKALPNNGGSAPATSTAINSSTVANNQAQAAALGITIPGVGGGNGLPTPTNATVTQNQQQAAAMGISIPGVGGTYTPPPPPPPPPTPPISSATLTPPTQQNFQQPTQTPTYPVSTLQAPDFSLSDAQKPASDLTKAIQNLNTQEAGKADYQTQQNSAFGVDSAQKSLTDLSTQLNGIKNEAAAIPLQLQQGAADRGVTTPVLGAQENSRLRTNAIAALGVSTLLNAAQGNLTTAQGMADKAVAQKYGPIEAQIDAGMKNLQLILNSPEYTNAEKQQAYQQQQALQQQSDQIAQQKQDYSNVLSISTSAAKNISNFTPTTQYPTAATALQAMSQATDPQAALQIAAAAGLTDNTSGTAKIIGSASSGYYAVSQDANGNVVTTPVKLGTNGQVLGASTGGYQAGMLTKLLQGQGKPTDDASLAQLYSSLGLQGTYANDTTHNAQIYQKLGGTLPTSDGGGAPTMTSAQVTSLKNALNASKFSGTEADGRYSDPNLYLQNYQSWIAAGGDAATFFKNFPPATYINPSNTSLPQEIMQFVKTTSSTGGSNPFQ